MGEFLGIVHLRAAVGVLACAIAGVAVASAHELGTTRVVVTIDAGRFAVEVSTDAAALLGRLEAAAQQRMSSPIDADEYERRLRAHAGELQRACELRFGGEVAPASIVVTVPETDVPKGAPASDVDAFVMPRAHVTLVGVLPAMPADSRALTWRYGLSATTYQLDVVSSGRTQTQWIEGGQWSAPATLRSTRVAASALTRSAALGVARVLPGGVDQILFLVGMYLAARRWRPLAAQVVAFAAAESLAFVVSRGAEVSPVRALAGPVVALSIAWVAFASLRRIRPGETGCWRLALLSAIGLAHGVGLAPTPGAAENASNFLVGTVAFGVGVQGGQALVLVIAALLLGAPGGDGRRQVAVPASMSIGMTGLYLAVLRLTFS